MFILESSYYDGNCIPHACLRALGTLVLVRPMTACSLVESARKIWLHLVSFWENSNDYQTGWERIKKYCDDYLFGVGNLFVSCMNLL